MVGGGGSASMIRFRQNSRPILAPCINSGSIRILEKEISLLFYTSIDVI